MKIEISDPNNEPVKWANQVLGQGHVNGVVNITLGQARFTPLYLTDDPLPEGESSVSTDMIVAARLRMDLACAKQLRDSLDALLRNLLYPQYLARTDNVAHE